MNTSPTPIPAQAPDYTRFDGATMRETVPGEFVNLAVLQSWGFVKPPSSEAPVKAKWAAPAPSLGRL